MATNFDSRQSVLRAALGMVGSSANDSLDTIFPKIDAELAKHFEDRNVLLTDGGNITFSGTQIIFTEALKITLNQKISGAAPQVISLGSTTIDVTNGQIWYAVINRSAGTATTTVGTTLPAATSANQEVFFIAKRVDAGDSTQRLYWRSGMAMDAGQTVRLGASSSGGGSGSGINYIANSTFDANTTGYNAYADAAGTAPVNGTGGSPSVTITRTTSTPLRGLGSGLFTKDAVNRQGEGVSYDFTIDAADKGKYLTFTMDYALVSGTLAAGDITAYFVDLTNGTVIQSSNYQIVPAIAGLSQKYTTQFPAAVDSTSYRLCLHVASTSALAYALKIDNLACGPSTSGVMAIGPVAEYTGVSGTFSTSYQTLSFTTKQADTNNAYTAPNYVVPVAGFYEVSASVSMNGTVSTGASTQIQILQGGVSKYVGSEVYFGNIEGFNVVKGILSCKAGDVISVQGKYSGTISGGSWGSGSSTSVLDIKQVGVAFGGSGEGRPVAAKAATTVVGSYPGSTTVTKIIFNSSQLDTHGAWDTTAGTYTVPVAGVYRVSAKFRYATTSFVSNQSLWLFLYKNSSELSELAYGTVDSNNNPDDLHGSTLVSCNAGDVLDIRTSHGSTGTRSDTGSQELNYVCIERLSSPTDGFISPNDSVTARYTGFDNVSVSDLTATRLNVAIKNWDNHNAVTTGSSWKFTAPIAGTYQVNAQVVYTAVPNTYYQLKLNGPSVEIGFTEERGTNSVKLSGQVKLLAGETFNIDIFNNNGGARSTSTVTYANFIDVVKVANY